MLALSNLTTLSALSAVTNSLVLADLPTSSNLPPLSNLLTFAIMALLAAVAISIVAPMITQEESPFLPSFVCFLFGFLTIEILTGLVSSLLGSKAILFILATPMVFGTMSLVSYYIGKAEIEKALQVGVVSVFVNTLILVVSLFFVGAQTKFAPNPPDHVENKADQILAFRDQVPQGRYLFGIQITIKDKSITSIQSAYTTAQGETTQGKVHGKESDNVQKAFAKKNFAVSGIDCRYAQKQLVALRLTFSPIDKTSELNEYQSEWIGIVEVKGEEKLRTQKDKFVSSFTGRMIKDKIIQLVTIYGKQTK